MLRNQFISTTTLLALSLCFACEEPPPSVSDKPEKPSAEIADIVCASPAPISGTKQSSTSIWINGKEAVPLDEKSTWSASIEVMEGKQSLTIVAKSATDQESDKIRKSTTLDLTKPTVPALTDMPPPVVMETLYTLNGSKEAGTAISIDGMVVVPADASETWTAMVMLTQGPNTLKISARDRCRDSDILEINLFQDETGIGLSVNPVMSPTCDDSIVITGERAPGVAILLNENLIVEAGESTEWMYTVMLTEGVNTLNFVGQVGSDISLAHTVTVEYDSTSPGPPTLNMIPPEFTSTPDLLMSGTKEANTAILINDSEVVTTDAMTSFMFNYTLQSGDNFLQLDTRDFCGRTSGNPIVANVTLDDTMPMLSVTAPMAGDTLTGLALIEGEATDNATNMMRNGVAAINITVDGQMIATLPLADTSTFSLTWDTTSVVDGSHLLSITAVDIAGLASAPVAIMIDVANLARVVSDDPPPAMWNSDPAQASSNRPSVAVTTNGAVGIVWRDNVERAEEENDKDIYLRMYGMGSSSAVIETVSDFTSATLDGVSENPNVCPAGSGGLHIVWKDDGDLDADSIVDKDIYYRHHDGAALGTNPMLVSQGTPPGLAEDDYESNYPHLAVDGTGLAHVVWQDNGNLDNDDDSEYDIYYSSGGQNGFNPPTLISDDITDGVSTQPRIAITPDNCPHVVWQDSGDLVASDNDMGLRDIYYRGATPTMGGSSCTNGFSWGPVVLISEENGFDHTYRPRIAADAADPRGLLYITWRAADSNVINNGSDADIFMANFYVPSTPAGRGSLILISDDINDDISRNPDVIIDSLGSIFVSWEDNGDINGAGTDFDIYMRNWNGSMFSPYSSISDIGMNMFNTDVSIEPSMAIDGTQLIVVWEDKSNYDGDMIPDNDIVMLVR